MSNQPGTLYVVATPIGNLQDLSARAKEVLSKADLIAAEDTRHSAKLLTHLGIGTPMLAYHEFNEQEAAADLVERMLGGMSVALISDAGTPLICDPGYRLVTLAHDKGVPVVPIPGPSAVMSALAVAGLPTDRFVFAGFIPQKAVKRRAFLKQLAAESGTVVLFETPHRILESLDDLIAEFGPARVATIGRELTKRFETVKRAQLAQLRDWISAAAEQQKGEFVIVVAGAGIQPAPDDAAATHVLEVLLRHHGAREAAGMAAEITGRRKNEMYRMALDLKKR